AARKFSIGEGWIGQVASTGKPLLTDDLHQLNTAQTKPARQLSIVSLMAFPILVADQVVAVMDFYSRHPAKYGQPFLDIMRNVGLQLGHVIERKRLQRAIADSINEQQRHFGRELHDSIAQQLTGLTMMAQTIEEQLT